MAELAHQLKVSEQLERVNRSLARAAPSGGARSGGAPARGARGGGALGGGAMPMGAPRGALATRPHAETRAYCDPAAYDPAAYGTGGNTGHSSTHPVAAHTCRAHGTAAHSLAHSTPVSSARRANMAGLARPIFGSREPFGVG